MTISKKSDAKKKRETAKKSMKNRMFFESAIWEAFWKGFGRVLGGQNPWFSSFFRSKMQAKNEMDWRRRKNRILEPQKQTADEVPRIAQVRGKELKDGGSLGIGCQSLKRQSQASIWRYEGVDEWEEHIRIMSDTQASPSGGGGCAVHAPPRCRGWKKSRSEFWNGFPA